MTFFEFSQIFGLESMETLNRSSNIPKLTVLKMRNPGHHLNFLCRSKYLSKYIKFHYISSFQTVINYVIGEISCILTGIWTYIKNLTGARGCSAFKLLILVYYCF